MDLDSNPFSQHSDIEEGFENSSVLGDDLNDCLTKSNMTAGIKWPSSPATETLDSSTARRFDLNGIVTESIEVPSLNNIPSLDSSSSTESPRQGQPVPPTIIQRSQVGNQDHTSSLESVRENSVMDELLPSTDRLRALDTLQPGQWLSATAIELVLSHWHSQEDFRLVDSSYLNVNHPEDILRKPALRLMGALRLLLPSRCFSNQTMAITGHCYSSISTSARSITMIPLRPRRLARMHAGQLFTSSSILERTKNHLPSLPTVCIGKKTGMTAEFAYWSWRYTCW